MRERTVLVLSLLAGGCYSPRIEEGVPCASNGECPGDLVCAAATNTCVREPGVVDAAGEDAAIDAVPDAVPDAALACPSGSQAFSATGAIVSFTVPGVDCLATMTIDAWGAQGGGSVAPQMPGGLGAHVVGTFTLAGGSELRILVGERGVAGRSTSAQRGGSGGGGTFVVLVDGTPLAIAGGGGGAVGGNFFTAPGGPGQAGPAGQAGAGLEGGAGGVDGGGGTSYQAPTTAPGTFHSATGGGGFLADGILNSNGGTNHGTPNQPGTSFMNGGAGGLGGSEGRDGGFGGGGAAGFTGGGGGGYSGGGSSDGQFEGYAGGGGGSFNAGANAGSEAGVQSGDGKVELSW